jgi:S-adenosylmethionine decarboxylase
MDGDASRQLAPVTQAVGTHWLVDCHGVARARLADVDGLRRTLRAAAEAAGATILFDHFHDFGEGGVAGVTGVVLLAESHATIHTWPATGFAAIDLFLCGATRPERAIACIEEALAPERVVVRREARGA